jgi:hypothetical protein
MHRWRTHSAWLLLVLLVLGGVAAPAVHQLQHEGGHAHHTVLLDLDRRPHAEIDHTVQSVDAEEAGAHAFYCLLCHTQLVSELGTQASAPAPQLFQAVLNITSSSLWGLGRLTPLLIRGPPATA